MKQLVAVGLVIAISTPVFAAGEKGVGEKNGQSNFERTHQAIDKNMNTGNDRSRPLGQGPGEHTGIGGAAGGGNQPGGANQGAINQRNQ